MNPLETPRLDRRAAIKWMATVAAATAALGHKTHAAEPNITAAKVVAGGYGTDPDLLRIYKPGDLWPLTMTDKQRTAAAALCAIIFPGDENTKNAAELNVHDFIDEWISAPYDQQVEDRPVILDGLDWIDEESQRRFSGNFADLDEDRQTAICDDICYAPDATADLAGPAKFFSRFRDLAAGGFYSTPEGMRNIGYIGNVPLASFEGPPPEVIARLGLDA